MAPKALLWKWTRLLLFLSTEHYCEHKPPTPSTAPDTKAPGSIPAHHGRSSWRPVLTNMSRGHRTKTLITVFSFTFLFLLLKSYEFYLDWNTCIVTFAGFLESDFYIKENLQHAAHLNVNLFTFHAFFALFTNYQAYLRVNQELPPL